jgi:hypothetical protein
VVDQVRFRVAGTDSASRTAQSRAGLVPLDPGEVGLVVDDSLCIGASTALASSGASRGMPAPFPVVVVRAGDRFVVRLPWDGRPVHSEPRTVVFDGSFHRLGEFGSGP